MFRETDIVRGTDTNTPRMQRRNKLHTVEETLFKIAHSVISIKIEEYWKTRIKKGVRKDLSLS